MQNPKALYVGIKGSVIALDAATGRQLWATHLKSSGFVNVLVQGDRIYAATYGELFCLDRATGNGLWSNPLTGFGRGLVCLATENSGGANLLSMAEQIQQEEAAAAAAASSAATSSAS